jgi:hypothetical protein
MNTCFGPAVFVDLVELEPDTDPGTDELALITHWEVRVIVSESQKETDKIIRSLILSIIQDLSCGFHCIFKFMFKQRFKT